MWELICHHTYKLEGSAIDLSDHDQHGVIFSALHSRDGATPGSGALNFRGDGRVHVPVSPVWRTLGGISIQITARINGPRANPRVLINGGAPRSFSLFTWNRNLYFTYATSHSTMAGRDFERISVGDVVPYDTWVTFGVIHNGLDTLQLYADGQLIAEKAVQSAVPGVQGGGVFIGHPGTHLTHVLDGDIDEVKVWRLDPSRVRNGFLARPLDEGTARCWEEVFRAVYAKRAEDPECAESLRQLPAMLDGLRRAIGALGPDARRHYLETCDEYARLWKAGQLDGPEMRKLVASWCEWLDASGIRIPGTSELEEIMGPCLDGVEVSVLQDCDPQLLALMEMFGRSCSGARGASPRSGHAH